MRPTIRPTGTHLRRLFSGQNAMLADGLLALLLTVFAQINLQFNLDNSTHYGSDLLAAVMAAVGTSALLLRRRAPLLCVSIICAAVAVPELFAPLTITLWASFVPLLIGAYSVSRHCGRRGATAGAALIVIALVVAMLTLPALGTVSNIPFTLIPFTVAIVAGRVLRRMQANHRRTTDLARRLEHEQEEGIAAALLAERTRIARELHDIVAHCVGVMVIQAGAAEDLLDRAPEQARAPLQAVQETGRQAVEELTRMLGLLRGARGGLALAPQPGTGELPDLVAGMTRAGLATRLEVSGPVRPLPAGIELTLYRVVQEALTNTLKHAGPAIATVRLDYYEGGVRVEVVDDGSGAPAGDHGGDGHGLVGIQERVTIYGGTLEAGPRPNGGFAVRVDVPVSSPSVRRGAAA